MVMPGKPPTAPRPEGAPGPTEEKPPRKVRVVHDGVLYGLKGWAFGLPKLVDLETGEEIKLGAVQKVVVTFTIDDFAMVEIIVGGSTIDAVGFLREST